MIVLLIYNPQGILSSMLTGGEKALSLTLKLVVIYAVWLGVSEILENTGITKKVAKWLKPINNVLFGKVSDKSSDYISVNLSANLLGMSGATTPYGIKAISELNKQQNSNYAVAMFFVINATSIQLIPSSVLALRSSLNSANPSSIILPTILATLVSSAVGIILVKCFIKKDN